MAGMYSIADIVARAITDKSIEPGNFWLYIENKGDGCYVSQEEAPREGYTGYFCEDASRIPGIMSVAERKNRRIRQVRNTKEEAL